MIRKINIGSLFVSILLITLPLSFFSRYLNFHYLDITLKIILIFLLGSLSLYARKKKYGMIFLFLAIVYLIENLYLDKNNSIVMWVAGFIAYLIIVCLPILRGIRILPNSIYFNFSYYLLILMAILSFYVAEKRFTHPYLNPNSVGLWISGILLYYLSLYKDKNLYLNIRFIFLIFFLLVTQSRSAILSFAIPFLLYLNLIKISKFYKIVLWTSIWIIVFYIFWFRGDFLYQILDPSGGRYQMYVDFFAQPVTIFGEGSFGHYTNAYKNICHLSSVCDFSPGALDSFYLSSLGNGGLSLTIFCIYCIAQYIKDNSHGNILVIFGYSLIFLMLGFTQAFNESFSFLMYIFGLTFFSNKIIGQFNVTKYSHSKL